jgi:hypothetical protein
MLPRKRGTYAHYKVSLQQANRREAQRCTYKFSATCAAPAEPAAAVDEVYHRRNECDVDVLSVSLTDVVPEDKGMMAKILFQ